MKKYIPNEIEVKWQKKWQEEGLYKTDFSKANKFYVLAEFAYPSGDLHMGHWFTFTGADIYARFKRFQGYNVFFPNGFDAFGLPAENAAIKNRIHPQDWTETNVARMKQQYSTMGASFDFYKDLVTSRSNYYKWNQWIFLKMLGRGLAYRDKYLSNWCPSCQTVLANEGVVEGKCWRCDNQVMQKSVEQWFLKITAYANRLIWPDPSTSTSAVSSVPNGSGLSNGVNWPKSVRDSQNIWIGKSEGIEIEFRIKNHESSLRPELRPRGIKVYTVFPETIFGVTYMVLAPEHKLAEKIATSEHKEQVLKYIKTAKKKSELERKENREKTGVFTGSYCINPANGEKVTIWIADYVIAAYGTGAVMGVPGSDHRDFEFAKKYNLEVIRVIGKSPNDDSPVESQDDVLEEGYIVNSAQFNGLKTPKQAKEKFKDWLEEKGYGKRKIQYHLHDWSISRQRYWGTPIPVVHCPNCGIVPVSKKDLPVELPYDVDYTPKGKSPLASNEAWMNVKCPNCSQDAKRDPDTMDTFVDSSWYFFRYISPDLETKLFDIDLAKIIMPVDIYFGGAEHTLGHTLYSRFFTKFFKDLGLTDLEEYAKRRVNHGIVLGPDGQKMSKSRGNVVNPDEEVKKFGADAVRIYLAFFMPYEGTGPWISERIWGPYRFLERVWSLFDKVMKPKASHPRSNRGSINENNLMDSRLRGNDNEGLSKKDLFEMNKTVKKVTDDIDGIKFNTAVAALMEWLNHLSRKEKVSKQEYTTFLLLLAPFAPHITEELWSSYAKASEDKKSIHVQKWPEVNPKYLAQEEVTVVVQVNGRVRETLLISKEQAKDKDEVEKIALESPKVQKFLQEKKPQKTIYVPGKVFSIVV